MEAGYQCDWTATICNYKTDHGKCLVKVVCSSSCLNNVATQPSVHVRALNHAPSRMVFEEISMSRVSPSRPWGLVLVRGGLATDCLAVSWLAFTATLGEQHPPLPTRLHPYHQHSPIVTSRILSHQQVSLNPNRGWPPTSANDCLNSRSVRRWKIGDMWHEPSSNAWSLSARVE
jgi:hypothetical protein